MSLGLTIPFSASTGSLGYFQVTEDEFDAVATDIHNILITNWGERVMHYNFGANFREFLFEQINDVEELKQLMADRVLSQMSLWLPFVVVDELNIFLSNDTPEISENEVGVDISFRLTSFPDLQGKRSFIV